MSGAKMETLADVVKCLSADERFGEWKLVKDGDDVAEFARGATAAVLVGPSVWQSAEQVTPHLARARSGNCALMLVGTTDDLASGIGDALTDVGARVGLLALPTSPAALELSLRPWSEAHSRSRDMAELEFHLERARDENDMLIDIGRALSQERDIGRLLSMILRRAREVTGADAGSLYVVEGEGEPAERTLRFSESQNDSIAMESHGFTMQVSPSSIVGACVLSAKVINIPDLYGLDEPGSGNNPWGFVHDRTFDARHGYQTRSMITVPMISARNQVIGVIQLINKRARGVTSLTNPADFDSKVLPFDEVSTNYASTLASQAGIALENALLYDEVKTLFEGFVKASVTAIEARDPTTSGHSERVASLTVELAVIADRADTGPYADFALSLDDKKQIEYAALLHDFGKVGVREHVLVKAKKLYEHDRALVQARFDYIRKALEAEHNERKLRYLLESSRDVTAEQLGALDSEIKNKLTEIDDIVNFVLQANQPTVLEQGGFERIADIATRTFVGADGKTHTYLTEEEATALQILRGSLTEDERREIESHVVHTYNFLRQIPWGRTFRFVPEIAGAHHEKLDGTGYPHGRPAEKIPPAARMMTISDIYDALTASDRPYKKAVPLPKALDILKSEVDRGKLDPALFQLFIDAKVWERALS